MGRGPSTAEGRVEVDLGSRERFVGDGPVNATVACASSPLQLAQVPLHRVSAIARTAARRVRWTQSSTS